MQERIAYRAVCLVTSPSFLLQSLRPDHHPSCKEEHHLQRIGAIKHPTKVNYTHLCPSVHQRQDDVSNFQCIGCADNV